MARLSVDVPVELRIRGHPRVMWQNFHPGNAAGMLEEDTVGPSLSCQGQRNVTACASIVDEKDTLKLS